MQHCQQVGNSLEDANCSLPQFACGHRGSDIPVASRVNYGLGIIGEVQIHDSRLYQLKLRVSSSSLHLSDIYVGDDHCLDVGIYF